MTNFQLTDSHCHLQDGRFDGDLAQVIARARFGGVSRFICNASAPSDWEKTLQIARDHPNILPCLGLHPLYVNKAAGTNWLDQLTELLVEASQKLTQPVGIGEIGLDRYVEPRDDQQQETAFRSQLQLAARLRKPVMLHSRRSLDRVIEMLKCHNDEISTFPNNISSFLLHGFAGPSERVGQIVKMGGYFSFSANLLKKNHKKMRQAAAIVPLDRILLESDAPDMPPPVECVPEDWPVYKDITDCANSQDKNVFFDIRNEPAIIPTVLSELAAIRKAPVAELAEIIAENEAAFFEKW